MLGEDPDGHKKYVLNPTVVTPELVILKVPEFPSVPVLVLVMVQTPDAVIL